MNMNPRPLALTIGVAVVGTATLAGSAHAAENPFTMRDLDGGYLQLAANEGSATASPGGESKGKEGVCAGVKSKAAADKAMEGKCGEGKCGASMNMPASVATPPAATPTDKGAEGKCASSTTRK